MRADKTDWFRATVMYIAVRLFGGSAWEGEKTYASPADENKFRDLIDGLKRFEGQRDKITLDEIDEKCDEARTELNLPK